MHVFQVYMQLVSGPLVSLDAGGPPSDFCFVLSFTLCGFVRVCVSSVSFSLLLYKRFVCLLLHVPLLVVVCC